jgi:hypothetical protein
MKKILIVMLILMMLFTLCLTAYASEAPAPFAKAKQLLIANDTQMLQWEIGDAVYFVGYLTNESVIGIGVVKNNKFLVAEYHELTGEFSIYRYSAEINERRMDTKENVTDLAFKIFREIVERKFI